MPLNTNGQNALVSGGLGNLVTHISLHNGDPSTSGANELTGGAPAYARKAVTWNAAASGQRTNNGALTFDVPAGTTVFHIGLWDAITVGNFYGYFPVGGFAPEVGSVASGTDLITTIGHGLSADNRVLVFDIQAQGVLQATEGTVYWVIATGLTADAFSISTSQGGAALNFTASGELAWMKVAPETFSNQGQFQIADAQLSLDARFV